MTNIAEALVATAVGLLVAIPAVASFNMFQRIVKTTLASTDALSHVLLAHLKSPQKFAVMGNHDVMVSRADVTDALVSVGVPVLHNSAVSIEKDGARLWVAGVADALCDRPDLRAAMPGGRNAASEPLILMAHEPDYADWVIGSGVDLMLSGHTHGGQVRIPFMPLVNLPPLGQKYVEGRFALGDLQLYVTRGIGTVGVPFRFRCPPEIALITLT